MGGGIRHTWVTKGREINITKRFLGKLNHIRRICVVAHKLSHLKRGHYYSRVGIIIVSSENTTQEKLQPISLQGGIMARHPSSIFLKGLE